MSPRPGRRSWPRLWPMRTGCWRRPGTPRLPVRPTAPTGAGLWRQPSSWAQLLHQDVARPAAGVRLKQGVSQDRIVSVHDPEMRHGRKSRSPRFDGHKAAIAVDPESQLITAVAVLPGNAPDAQGALELVAQSERHTGVPVTETIADAAYGDGHTRQQFADAGRTLIAKVPKRPARTHFPKEDFQIDLAAGTCTCPAGQVTVAPCAGGAPMPRPPGSAGAAALFPL